MSFVRKKHFSNAIGFILTGLPAEAADELEKPDIKKTLDAVLQVRFVLFKSVRLHDTLHWDKHTSGKRCLG